MKKTDKAKVKDKVGDKVQDQVGKPVTPGREELKVVAMGLVRPDPGQPRKEFDGGKLRELADSIASVGLQQRPAVQWVGPWTVKEPDLVEKDWRVVDEAGTVVAREAQENLAHMHVADRREGYYQLIFGERRWRACQLLGWKELPVVVREVEPARVFGVQYVENQQRENLSALEEAEGIRGRLAQGDLTAEELAKELGVSRATLFGRLALTRLPEPVMAAMKGGRISTSVAQLVAMVPEAKAQAELLEEIGGEADPESKWDGPAPFREVAEMIEEEYCKPLKGAPFDAADAELVPTVWEVREKSEGRDPKAEGKGERRAVRVRGARPEIPERREAYPGPEMNLQGTAAAGTWGVYQNDTVGTRALRLGLTKGEATRYADVINGGQPLEVERVEGGACGDCPWRSGNLPAFPDAAKRPNLCTRPGCYHAKVKAHWVAAAAKKVKAGEEVLDAVAYRRAKKEWVEGDKNVPHCQSYGTWKELMGKHAPKGTLATTDAGLVTVYPAAAAMAAVRQNGKTFYREDRAQTPEQKQRAAATEAEKKARAKRREELVQEWAPRALAGLEGLSEKATWELLERVLDDAVNAADFGLKPKTARGRVLALCLDDPTDWNGEWSKGTVAQWKGWGVDLVALERAAEAKAGKEAANDKPQTAKKK